MKGSDNHLVKFCFLVVLFLYTSGIIAQAQSPSPLPSPYTLTLPQQKKHAKESSTSYLKMGTSVAANGDRLSYNTRYLIKNGQPWYPVMGEMHFSRVPHQRWEQEILKMKSEGIQVISTYIIWNHLERKPGVFDWTGNNNLRRFIELCKKHHMYVWLRPGPWVHAEVRNGGFPDWLLKGGFPLRTMNKPLLDQVQNFFTQIGRQSAGYLFKDNGPIIGLQIENELQFTKPSAYAYMKALKQLAIQVGLDVPYYSAFAEGPDNQDEFLYMLGGYPDSPWSGSTKKFIKPMFFIGPLESDGDIGADLFGQVSKKVRNTYPKLSAEIGGGMQVTYHRRVEISAHDLAANSLVKIASGLNGLGYYMFHGGVNPSTSPSLQESRQSNYPNDVPLINYDFQAPLGAIGNAQVGHGELRLLNLFLADYGNQLATMAPVFPEARKTSLFSTDTIQCSIRQNDGHGFIFVSNYQRYVSMDASKSLQFNIIDGGRQESIPRRPTQFGANTYAIWPYHLSMENIVLDYSTAQPLCILHNGNGKTKELTYVFFGDGQTEFKFRENTYKKLQLRSNCQRGEAKNQIICKSGQTGVFDLMPIINIGKKIRIIVLPKALALKTYKFKNNSGEILLITDGDPYQDGQTFHIEKTAMDKASSSARGSKNETANVMIYPQLSAQSPQKQTRLKKKKTHFPFKVYQLSPVSGPIRGSIKLSEMTTNTTEKKAAKEFSDSIIQNLSKSKYFKPDQRGPLYQINFHNLPDQKKYLAHYDLPTNSLVKDWRWQIVYNGDVMALYEKDKLVYDQFNYNDSCLFSPTYLSDQTKGDLTIQILPGYKNMHVFQEDAYKLRHPTLDEPASLMQLSLMPVYHYTLTLK